VNAYDDFSRPLRHKGTKKNIKIIYRKNAMKHSPKNENGTITVVAMLVLAMLSVMGISSINTASIEIEIAGNEKQFVRDFYVADGAWKIALQWLNNRSSAPGAVNTSGDIVRNYGNGGEDVTNDTFADGTEDGSLEGTKYWFKVELTPGSPAGGTKVPGSSDEYRRFSYLVTSNADRKHEIVVRTNKVYRVGE